MAVVCQLRGMPFDRFPLSPPTHYSPLTHNSLFTKKPTRSWCLNILFNVQPKRHKQVDDKRRPKSDEGQINKIQPDPGRIDTHPFTKLLAYAESRFFQEMPVVVEGGFYVVE